MAKGEILHRSVAALSEAASVKEAAQKILDAVKEFLQRVKAVFTGNRQAQNEAAQREFGMELTAVEEAAKLWQEALTATQERAWAGNKNAAQQSSIQERYLFKGYDKETGRGIYEASFPIGTPKSVKSKRILELLQNVWSKQPIDLIIRGKDGSAQAIQAKFDPTYDENPHVRTDASKLMGGNRHGSAAEQRVTLSLADDYHQIVSDATYNYSKDETGKQSDTHKDVHRWHYFINDILFKEQGEENLTPYRVTINIKEKSDGQYVYSFNAEKDGRSLSTRQTLHADVTSPETDGGNAQTSKTRIAEMNEGVKQGTSNGAEVKREKALAKLRIDKETLLNMQAQIEGIKAQYRKELEEAELERAFLRGFNMEE